MGTFRQLLAERQGEATNTYKEHLARANKAAMAVIETTLRQQALAEQNARREGTPLEAVLGPDEAASCREFLEDMAETHFDGALTFREAPTSSNGSNGRRWHWGNGRASAGPTVRAYPIGYLSPPDHWVDLQKSTPRSVLLCEDGTLRTAPTEACADSTGYRLVPVTTERLQALPIDAETLETVKPAIGVYADIQGSTASFEAPDGTFASSWRYDSARFVPMELTSDVLVEYASQGSLPHYAY